MNHLFSRLAPFSYSAMFSYIKLYAHLWALSAAGGLRPGVYAGLTGLLFEAHLWVFSLVWLEPQYFSRENFMSGNYYSEINLHLIWHTKESLPLISDRIEPVLYRYIRQRIINTQGIFVHEIGGTETHIHVALIIQPTIQISDFVGQLKGASSHEINQKLSERDKILQWQSGYGVVSFGTGDLDWVIDYIRRQKEHHAQGKIHERLERINAETQ